jgi:hypothetical protein
MSKFSLLGAATALFYAGAALLPGPAAAQQKAAVPDFTVDDKSAWLMVGDELPPPPSGPGPITFDKRYPYVDNARARRTGTQPTYRVADLNNPILQPWAVEQFGGPEVRRIFLDVPHSAQVKPSWYGESVGHYEGGDTLVVDTIGQTTKTFVDSYLTPHTDKLHVVERYKLVDGGKAIEVLITVDDPGAFTTPWSALQRFRRVPRKWTEDICAENNFDFLQYEVTPLPQADKPDF